MDGRVRPGGELELSRSSPGGRQRGDGAGRIGQRRLLLLLLRAPRQNVRPCRLGEADGVAEWHRREVAVAVALLLLVVFSSAAPCFSIQR